MSGSTSAAGSRPPAQSRPYLGSARPRIGCASAVFPGWPLVSRLVLGPLAGAVPCARLHTKVILGEWDLAQVADDAEVVVSELTTNALKASWSLSEPQPIVLHLLASREWLTVGVWDALPAAPEPRPHPIDAETGRGLEIVSAVCDRWGSYRPDGGGKIVWAAIKVGLAGEAAR